MKPAAAIYLRVSTGDQTVENQRRELLPLLKARGLTLVATYEEKASAAGPRPAFARMLEQARRGMFGVVLVWSLDRFGRSMFGNLRDLLELERFGVRVVSARESWLDVDGPTRHLMVTIISWVAEQERARIIERTKAGMARARAEGKQIGRSRRVTWLELGKIRRLQKEGRSVRQIAVALKIPRSTIHRTLSRKGVIPKDV